MYRVFLAGGIASGKSTVARELRELGAEVCDLDQVSRQVTASGSPVVRKLADAFGSDLVDPATGELDRHLLARRAFASGEGTRRLERIELPAIGRALEELLAREGTAPVRVVEVPLLDRVESLLDRVDEVVCVVCPLDVRRERAIGRGMDAADFDRRVAQQPSEAYLRAHADTIFENGGSSEELASQVRAWWDGRSAAGWRRA